jgi:capsid protein
MNLNPFSIFKRTKTSASNYLNASSSGRRKVFYGKPKENKRDLRPNVRERLVENGRGLSHSSGQIAQIQQDYRIYAVGDAGFTPKPMTADLEWNASAKAYFQEWARRCDITGRYNLTELCLQIAGILPVDGEVFAIKTRAYGEPVIQLCETHQFSTTTDEKKNIYDGVKFNRLQRPVAYMHIDRTGKESEVKASAVMHVHNPYRPSAVRFAPHIQHSIDKVIDTHEIMDAETSIIKVFQDVARVLTSEEEGRVTDDDFQIHLTDAEATASENDSDSTADQIYNTRGEKTIQMKPGEKLETLESNRPNATFLDLMGKLQRDASLGIVPYEFSYDPNGVNGGALRLIVGKADRIFRSVSRIIINRFLEPVWVYVIGDAIDRGLLAPVPGWNRCHWTPPKRLTVDFGRDAMQNRLDIEAGLKSYDEDYEERGLDPDEQFEVRKQRARKLLTACGYPEERPIPIWMMVKLSGMSLSDNIDTGEEADESVNESDDDDSA